MAILRYFLPITLVLSMTGCYENFAPKIDTDPVLCINSLITAGEPIEVRVSHTWVYNNEKDSREHTVDDAEVFIYANGELRPEGYIAREGDDIRIVAESRKYGSAEATVTVPKAVPVSSIEFHPQIMSTGKEQDVAMNERLYFNMNVFMRIVDSNSTDDFFKLELHTLSPEDERDSEGDYEWSDISHVSFYTGSLEYNAEPIFKEYIGILESVMGSDDDYMMVFSDRQFSGKEYTLNLQFSGAGYSVYAPEYDPALYDCSIVFTLATVSRSYYNWALYVWQRDSGVIIDLGDVGFAEPMWGYSNVSTGAGIVAARSLATYTLNLKDFIQRTLMGTE